MKNVVKKKYKVKYWATIHITSLICAVSITMILWWTLGWKNEVVVWDLIENTVFVLIWAFPVVMMIGVILRAIFRKKGYYVK